jgi:hypothetical protein
VQVCSSAAIHDPWLSLCVLGGKEGDLIEGNNVNGVWDVHLGWVLILGHHVFWFLFFCLWVSLLFLMFPSGFEWSFCPLVCLTYCVYLI